MLVSCLQPQQHTPLSPPASVQAVCVSHVLRNWALQPGSGGALSVPDAVDALAAALAALEHDGGAAAAELAGNVLDVFAQVKTITALDAPSSRPVPGVNAVLSELWLQRVSCSLLHVHSCNTASELLCHCSADWRTRAARGYPGRQPAGRPVQLAGTRRSVAAPYVCRHSAGGACNSARQCCMHYALARWRQPIRHPGC